MTDDDIKREIAKLYHAAPDSGAIEPLDIYALCIRVRDEQREVDAEKCDVIASVIRYSDAERIIRQCAAAIRNGKE